MFPLPSLEVSRKVSLFERYFLACVIWCDENGISNSNIFHLYRQRLTAMAKAGSDGLITIAGGDVMNAIVDNHEAPMVISSVMKQNCTERGRRIVECGMDIAAGSAICRGDKNYMGNAYMSLPIAITVEGANIMTRSFQIIGQGLTRCHVST